MDLSYRWVLVGRVPWVRLRAPVQEKEMLTKIITMLGYPVDIKVSDAGYLRSPHSFKKEWALEIDMLMKIAE